MLVAIVLLAMALRLAGAWVLQHPLNSDPLAYFTMAQGLAERGELTDMYGQKAFYSAGYPLLLAPFFKALGSSVGTAIAANLLLCAISIWLIYKLTVALSGLRGAGLIAAAIYALWFPGLWNATMLAKENLSTPFLLGITLCAIAIARGERPAGAALVAGLLWGAALVTGGSALLLCLGVAVALLMLMRARARFAPAFAAGLCFIIGAVLMLAPWLYTTDLMVGRPVLTTNAAFNLYLGNNPAATGRFVSIADTPLAKDWDSTRLRLGEAGNADRLQGEALNWIKANPGRAAELAALKLAYFWQPNLPDARDFAVSKALASIRLIEVAQYGLILLIGLLAFRSRQIASDGKWIFAAMIAGFWLIHAAAYIIVRYRDPVIPLLIIMAAIPVTAWVERLAARRNRRHAG
ncbi:ArnT family glycosyltransferase [Sphingopyxis sp.]|uniref:ArnT family glycosyltransferase n=1 Tax=Sphingopyxis sp. TaxID=1908224 RepID=UPI003D10D756